MRASERTKVSKEKRHTKIRRGINSIKLGDIFYHPRFGLYIQVCQVAKNGSLRFRKADYKHEFDGSQLVRSVVRSVRPFALIPNKRYAKYYEAITYLNGAHWLYEENRAPMPIQIPVSVKAKKKENTLVKTWWEKWAMRDWIGE